MASRIGLWIYAFRPHTLPLASSGILMGNFIALQQNHFSTGIFVLALLTAILLQILSNLANDYGDHLHGVDNPNRIGPKRVTQSGEVSIPAIKRMIIAFILLSLVSGVGLLILSYKNTGLWGLLILLGLGLLAIWAAWNYTASKNPYGYRGLGDIFVFSFFGLVCVLGSYYLQTGTAGGLSFLPAVSIGLFSTAVLNINNIRDIDSDTRAGKFSVPVLLGVRKAKIYHLLLCYGGIVAFLIYFFSFSVPARQTLLILPLYFIAIQAHSVYRADKHEQYTPLLKKLSLLVLLLVLGFGVTVLFF
jgi:1,4-dihydroxy-2-naphthoate octaprenyltransferase